MAIEEIYPGTSVTISITVRKVSDSSLVNPTTLALVISENDDTLATATVKAIGDMDNPSTGLYTYVHQFPSSATEGYAYIKVVADAAIPVTTETNVERIYIKALPSQVV